LEDVIGAIQAEQEIVEQQHSKSKIEAQQKQAFQQVMVAAGDCFTGAEIREALAKTGWDPEQAQERLFQEKHAVDVRSQPAINVKSLLDVCRARNAARKLQEADNYDSNASESDDLAGACATSGASTASSEEVVCKPSNNIKMIQEVFEEIRRKNYDSEQKTAATEEPIAASRGSIPESLPRKAQGKREFVKMRL
jgi:hypothetical protein